MADEPKPRPRVLVVDDNDVNRLVLTRMVEILGGSHAQARDGSEGLALVLAGGVAVVLMDVQMPVMDGLAATRAIRAAGHRMPVIGVSAHGLDEDRAEALAAGMDDYLVKPVSIEVLRRALAQHLRQAP